jgi:hypothetical protein
MTTVLTYDNDRPGIGRSDNRSVTCSSFVWGRPWKHHLKSPSNPKKLFIFSCVISYLSAAVILAEQATPPTPIINAYETLRIAEGCLEALSRSA